jgi:hypothetical protein
LATTATTEPAITARDAAGSTRTFVAWLEAQMLKLAAIAVFLVVGCNVPDITLVPDDAPSDDVPSDDGAGEDDSSPPDASPDALDGSTETGSCGNVTCSGDCSDASCPTCISKCTATQLCCVHLQNVTCHALGTTCP